jgi:hypothetical protein
MLFLWHSFFFCVFLEIVYHFLFFHFLKLSFFETIRRIGARVNSVIRVFVSVFLKRHRVTSFRD